MADDFLEHVRGLLREQAGVITRQQALAAGLTSKAIEFRLDGGRWQRLQTGVYAAFSGQAPRPARLWAAVLRAGPDAVLSHHTAAELQGLSDSPAPLIHVSVPSGAKVARPLGVRLHYSGRLAQSRHPALAPPRTRIEDTVLDLAADAATVDEAVSMILRGVGKRLTTAPLLAAALARRTRMRWRADLTEALCQAQGGTHSLLEFRYVTRVERPHGLPPGTRQRPVLRAGHREYQDIAYDGYQTVVELDGRAAHPADTRWRDARRDNLNAAFGLVTIRLGYVDVSQRPCASAALIGRVLAQRGWDGVLRRCGRTCQLPATAGYRNDRSGP